MSVTLSNLQVNIWKASLGNLFRGKQSRNELHTLVYQKMQTKQNSWLCHTTSFLGWSMPLGQKQPGEKKDGFWGGEYAGMQSSGKEKGRRELLCECEGEWFLKTLSIFSKVERADLPAFIINTPISDQSLLWWRNQRKAGKYLQIKAWVKCCY